MEVKVLITRAYRISPRVKRQYAKRLMQPPGLARVVEVKGTFLAHLLTSQPSRTGSNSLILCVGSAFAR